MLLVRRRRCRRHDGHLATEYVVLGEVISRAFVGHRLARVPFVDRGERFRRRRLLVEHLPDLLKVSFGQAANALAYASARSNDAPVLFALFLHRTGREGKFARQST